MNFTYRLQKETSGWLATCVESDAMGEGPTEEAAIGSLREALEERMFRPDAVAPPAEETKGTIDLSPAPPSSSDDDALDPGGPGG
ncbi:MAG: hypothetical protein JWP97_4445 [Labilithrix sp.]|nr:hypothetical protein [Labilithrix sp.]